MLCTRFFFHDEIVPAIFQSSYSRARKMKECKKKDPWKEEEGRKNRSNRLANNPSTIDRDRKEGKKDIVNDRGQ